LKKIKKEEEDSDMDIDVNEDEKEEKLMNVVIKATNDYEYEINNDVNIIKVNDIFDHLNCLYPNYDFNRQFIESMLEVNNYDIQTTKRF